MVIRIRPGKESSPMECGCRLREVIDKSTGELVGYEILHGSSHKEVPHA